MQQGSNQIVSAATPGGLAQPQQAAWYQAVQEIGAMCSGIQHISRYCADQGHVTQDHIEQIAALSSVMHRHLATLGSAIADH